MHEIFSGLRTQWHYSIGGRAAYNYDPALRLAAERGFDLNLFTQLLQAIEYAHLKIDHEKREAEALKR